MGKSDSTMIAIGGGEFAKGGEVMTACMELIHAIDDPKLCVMTVATDEPESAGAKYNSIFRSHGVKHVSLIDIDQREDSFAPRSLEKIKQSDVLFFTGGDQLHVTSLMGGSPVHYAIRERVDEGIIIIGTSAGAMMMSTSMIISGKSDHRPELGAVEIAPGMDLIPNTIIDTHFAQRGRHGRLITAIAHYPQNFGIGIDENTAMIVKENKFKVVGAGSVTILDGNQMRHSDLAYKQNNEPLGIIGLGLHVLPPPYSYNFKTREPEPPPLKKLKASANE